MVRFREQAVAPAARSAPGEVRTDAAGLHVAAEPVAVVFGVRQFEAGVRAAPLSAVRRGRCLARRRGLPAQFVHAPVLLCLSGAFLLLVTSILVQGARWKPGGDEVSSGAQQTREQAFRLHREKRWADAVAAYDDLLAESERDAELHYWRGMARWQLGQPDQALQDFRRVIELEPANFEAHRSADRIPSGQRRWDEILEMWNRYIARTPASADAYFERGGTNFHKGDLVAAQADAARACELGKAEACPWAERLKRR
jgi:tetratricopeptide (TPR) repeat protein